MFVFFFFNFGSDVCLLGRQHRLVNIVSTLELSMTFVMCLKLISPLGDFGFQGSISFDSLLRVQMSG